MDNEAKHRILFVCHGNICRSPMADSWNIRNMRNICGGDPEGKIVMLMDFTKRPGDVADPWYTGNFEATWRDVLEGCQALLDRLAKGCD